MLWGEAKRAAQDRDRWITIVEVLCFCHRTESDLFLFSFFYQRPQPKFVDMNYLPTYTSGHVVKNSGQVLFIPM